MLKHTNLILPAHIHENRVMAIAWSPDCSMLAAALADNTVYTFHGGVMKHLIRMESLDSGVQTKTNHSIRGIAFSPDSTKLSVALASGAVYVHSIENDWTCDATLCNEFLQNSPVTCLVWSAKGSMVFGLENGKIRASQIETEMVCTLYSTDSSTIAIAINDTSTAILSSHADGSIFHCHLPTSDNSTITASRIFTRLSISLALAWTRDKIIIVDVDNQVTFHDDNGKVLKIFDCYQESSSEKSSYACCSATKTNVVVGLCGRVHLYTWVEKNEFWEEIDTSATDIVDKVTALALRKDGTKLAIGGLRGVVAEFKTTDKCSRSVGVLIRNVDSNLVSGISLENDDGQPGATIWPMLEKKYLETSLDETSRKSTKTEKPVKIVKTTSSLIVTEPKNKSEIVSGFATWIDKSETQSKKKSKSSNPIDYISSDVATSPDKSSFTMDLGSILSTDDDEFDNLISFRCKKPVKDESFERGRLKDCPRCGEACRTIASSPIRFTRQYTPEELRSDFTLQLALLASLSPGLQRVLERQMFGAKI